MSDNTQPQESDSMDLTFTFEGRAVRAREGQSIAAALLQDGERVLSHSAKYRRPRGLRCGTGSCPGCLLRVNGEPGVLSCMTPVRAGDVVERERPFARALPLDALPKKLTRAGFYYERAKTVGQWKRAAPWLARIAGVSDPPSADPRAIGAFEERAVDSLIVGAGRAGLEAAIERGGDGHSVLVVERDYRAGGRLLNSDEGRARAAELLAAAQDKGVEVLLGATAIGTFDEGVCVVVTSDRMLVLEPGEIVRAAGSIDREYALPDGDRPGVMLSGAVRRLVGREGVRPGSRAVIAAADPAEGAELAELLRDAGVEVAGSWQPQAIRSVHGRTCVKAVSVQEVAGSKRVECDLLVLAVGRREADEHASQAKLGFDPMGQATALRPASERSSR